MIMFIPFLAISQNWQWAKHAGSSYLPYNERAKVISDGTNSYLIGSFGGSLYQLNDTITSYGSNNMFIAKYDQSGNELWAKTVGGLNSSMTDWEDMLGVYDAINNCIYVTGKFYNTIYFDTLSPLTSSGNMDIFLARMDLNGNFIWAKKAGSTGLDASNVFADPNGNILIAGKVSDTAYFDAIKVSPGGYMAKYDSNGNCLWAEHKFLSPENSKISISFIGSDIVMCGFFSSNPSFIDTVTLIPLGSFDGFLSRMDSLGKIKWIKTVGSNGIDGFEGVSVDNSDNIYATGIFQDTIFLANDTLISQSRDLFVSKFDQNGNLIWARQTYSAINTGANDIVSDSDGNCYLTGTFSGNSMFGTFNLSTTNSSDMFLARYDFNGNCLGAKNFGSASGAYLAVDNYGSVYCSGVFQNTVNIGSTTLASYGGFDIFLAKSDAITGVRERRAPQNQLLIYANPTAGKCNITVPDEFKNNKNLTLSIYASDGKLIQQKKMEMNNDKIKLDLEAEAKGVYNITLTNGIKSYSGKIVFE